MLEFLVVYGVSWYVGKWLIALKPTLPFLFCSLICVCIVGTVTGFIFQVLYSTAIEHPNGFGAAVEGAMRGGMLGLFVGGWSIVRTYRTYQRPIHRV
jgi:hypothetical protein